MSQAQNPNQQEPGDAKTRRPRIPNLPYEKLSKLGRDLFDMSRDYEASGEPLLSEEEIEQELTRRRGGYTQDAVQGSHLR
jgi:hypothetical protein